MDLFTNTSSRSDFFRNAFIRFGNTPRDVYIAVAFFTYPDPIINLAETGSRVRLIVRLGYPTKPEALKQILGKESIQVRFVNDRSFHPKLYIFGGCCATVGSSNLTDPALYTNQEVNITVEPSDPRYNELVSLFVEWWDQAKVLDDERLKEYTDIYERCRKKQDNEHFVEDELQKTQGRVTIRNIRRGLGKPSSSEIYLEQYRADYQTFLDAYKTVERVYGAVGRRKYEEDVLPLRLEVDSYFSFIREKKAPKDTYLSEAILVGEKLEAKIRSTVEEWIDTPWRWLEEEIVPKRYPIIKRVFSSQESIANASFNEIAEALSTCHSFYDRFRFYAGGHDAHIQEFKETNDLQQIRETLTYLLFGRDNFIRRMGRCIFDPAFKLNSFGQSNVQELLGWINNENIPVCNNRTTRSLRWLGFDIKLFGG